MPRMLSVLILALSAVPVAWAQYAPQIDFEWVPDFFSLPQDMNFGEVSAIAVNSEDHVFVFHRSSPSGGGPAYGISAARLWEFDAEGRYLREHGGDLYAWSFAHGLRIDANDDIWTVDKGSNMVVRMNPRGRVVWGFGRETESVSRRPVLLNTWIRPSLTRTGDFANPLTWPSIRRATSMSATVMSTRGWRNTTITGTG